MFLLNRVISVPSVARQKQISLSASSRFSHTAARGAPDRRSGRRVDYYGDKWQDKEILKDIQWLRAQ